MTNSLRRRLAAEKAWRRRKALASIIKEAEETRAARRRPLTVRDCVYFEDDPNEPCWGEVTCWEHDASDHPGCEALCHGHRDFHPGNDFHAVYIAREYNW